MHSLAARPGVTNPSTSLAITPWPSAGVRRPATADLRATLLTWGPIVAGLGFMYGPSFVDLFRGIWSTDEQAYGPIVLGVSCWLVWRNWPAMWARSEGAQTSAAGWPVVVVGLLLYIVGRSQEILLFEIGSLIWLLTGQRIPRRGRHSQPQPAGRAKPARVRGLVEEWAELHQQELLAMWNSKEFHKLTPLV